MMDKIYEILGLTNLDESVQTEVKQKLSDIIDIKAKEVSESLLKEKKEELITEYEEKFEEYKSEITSKFSNFVDSILDEELSIPENILEYAHKGELYSDLIEQFKVRLAIDEGILDDEVKGLLREAKEEIISLKEEINNKTAIELEQQNDLQEMSAALYIRKKCDGLTESQKTKIMSILEGITEKSEIDRKYNVILESINEKEEMEEEEETLGEGHENVETKEVLNENYNGAFDNYIDSYVSVLKENKI